MKQVWAWESRKRPPRPPSPKLPLEALSKLSLMTPSAREEKWDLELMIALLVFHALLLIILVAKFSFLAFVPLGVEPTNIIISMLLSRLCL